MALGNLVGIALTSTGPTSGATVYLYLASRFASQPAQGNAAPGGAADYGPVTSGVNYGSAGAYTFTSVNTGDYYVLVEDGGINYWTGPLSVVEDSTVVHIAGTETITGAKTFSGAVTFSGTLTFPGSSIPVSALSGVLPVANGGTGSSTQNFVDVTTNQTVAGNKTFAGVPVFQNGFTVTGGGLTFPNGSIPAAAVEGLTSGFAGVDIASTQSITGQKTFLNDIATTGGNITASAITTPTAPVVTPTGGTGSTTYQYQVVKETYDGHDSVPSPTGETTTGVATLSPTEYNLITWTADTVAASYKILRYNSTSSTWQLLTSGLTGTSYEDNGSAVPTSYSAASSNPGGAITAQTVTVNETLTATNYNATGNISASGSLTAASESISGTATVGSLSASGAVSAQTVQANFNADSIGTARCVGSVPFGGPISGTWNTGDWGTESIYGSVWACQTGGTPGSWILIGTGGIITRAHRIGGLNLAVGWNAITCDTVDYGSSSWWYNGSNYFVAPVTGYYQVSYTIALINSSTDFMAALYQNGGTVTTGSRLYDTGSSNPASSGADIVHMNKGDTLELYAYSANTAYINSTSQTCFLAIALV